MDGRAWVKSEFAKHVLRRDDRLCSAIDKSIAFFPQFCATFSQPAIRQVNFIATVFETPDGHGGRFAPVGISVNQVDDGVIVGCRIDNSSSIKPLDCVACGLDDIVDLRYIDTFECEGGFLFKELYLRQPRPVRNRIWEAIEFLPEWNPEARCDVEFRELLRHIANHRCHEALSLIVGDRSLASRLEYMPRPGHSTHDSRVMLGRTSPAQYAAEFGGREIIFALHDVGVLGEDAGRRPPLCSSAIRGNYDTTLAMLDLGYDVEVTDEHGGWPLHHAAMCGRPDIVDLLIQRGADVNRVDNRGMTGLFLAGSKEVVQELLDAGGRIDFKDDQHRDCAAYHNEHGRSDIVEMLVSVGAQRPDAPLGLNDAEVVARGRTVLDEMRETAPKLYATLTASEQVDWGYVLPVKYL